jgi:hypothetical protein
MTEQERQAALARLTSTDTASLKQEDIARNSFQGTMDEYDAINRLMANSNITDQFNASISRLMSPYAKTFLDADNLRKIMVQHLQKSDLTVNFRVSDLFASKLKGGIMNTFERPGHSAGGYLNTRNQTEENLFGYSNSNSHTGGSRGIFDRMSRFGNMNNNADFAPSMRPKYGALNFTNQRIGAAPAYGRSFMVLKEHVKHNCTFTDRDSFSYAGNPSGGDKVATYHNMDRIIANLPDNKLDQLYTMVTSLGSQLNPISYIEAQIHGEIIFNRDIRKMCIDSMDLNFSTPQTREHLEHFSRKFSIPVTYL